MGARLVGEALLPMWVMEGMTHAEHVMQITMAHSALDEGDGQRQARMFYGGHEHLALAVWGVAANSPRYPSVRRQVVRALKHLEELGAVRRIRTGGGRRRAVYEVLPWTPKLVDNSELTTGGAGDKGDTRVPSEGTPVSPRGGHQSPL